jgi:exopolyphosphatase/guanosine-5'-triphosphate,3'-diphosphate pyrophosphatase
VTRVASIDIGTNSTRLLVADVEDGTLAELDRRLAITRLGDRVDSTGHLNEDSMERVHERLAEYAAAARELGADPILATATSAVRDAANGEEFLAEIERRHAIRTRLLSGEEEARTTFAGVTSAHPVRGDVLVCDVGGGSTELLKGGPDGVRRAVSLDMGCVRMSERFLASDPPSGPELSGLRDQVRAMLPDWLEGELIGVAGTVTTLATIDLGLDDEVPELIDGHRLPRAVAERELARLAGMTLAERREVRGLMPARAPTIVAGTAILCEVMDAARANELTVSERDILHGAALLAANQTSD